jgi:HPt (histidine-containing phosphotransfer) domain-containing protein
VPDATLNLSRLTDLLGDDREAIAEIFDLAVGTCRNALETLRGAARRSAPGEIERAAHAMKGAAANVGAEGLSAAAARLEEQARRRRIVDLDTSVQAIGDEFARFEAAVRAYQEAGILSEGR